MIIKPILSPTMVGEGRKVNFAVAVKLSEGNFCSNKFGISHKLT